MIRCIIFTTRISCTMSQTTTQTITQTDCQKLLIDAVKSQPQFRDNISKLTQVAWGTSKNECRTLM